MRPAVRSARRRKMASFEEDNIEAEACVGWTVANLPAFEAKLQSFANQSIDIRFRDRNPNGPDRTIVTFGQILSPFSSTWRLRHFSTFCEPPLIFWLYGWAPATACLGLTMLTFPSSAISPMQPLKLPREQIRRGASRCSTSRYRKAPALQRR